MWDAVAAHSARYDRDHIRRVTHRETPRRRGKGMSDVTDPKIWKAGEYKESELAAITQQDSHDATEEEMLAVSDVPTTRRAAHALIFSFTIFLCMSKIAVQGFALLCLQYRQSAKVCACHEASCAEYQTQHYWPSGCVRCFVSDPRLLIRVALICR